MVAHSIPLSSCWSRHVASRLDGRVSSGLAAACRNKSGLVGRVASDQFGPCPVQAGLVGLVLSRHFESLHAAARPVQSSRAAAGGVSSRWSMSSHVLSHMVSPCHVTPRPVGHAKSRPNTSGRVVVWAQQGLVIDAPPCRRLTSPLTSAVLSLGSRSAVSFPSQTTTAILAFPCRKNSDQRALGLAA